MNARTLLPRTLALAAALALPASAAFEDLGAGARAPGMGNAFVAVADDVYTIHYNPAGLAGLERPQFGAAYTRLHMGLTDNSDLGTSFIGYAHPLREGRDGTVASAWNSFTLNDLYREDTLFLSYARTLFGAVDGDVFSGGLSLKYLRSSFGSFPETNRATRGLTVTTTQDPVLSGSSSQGAIDADLGFLYRFHTHYGLGLMVQHVPQPNVAFSSADTDRVPMAAKAAFNYRGLLSNLVAQVDTTRSPTGSRDFTMTVAAERWFPRRYIGEFGLRGGLANGSRDFRQMTAGVSFRTKRMGVDYGFGIPLSGISETGGSHRFALSFKFGRPSEREESAEMVLEAMREMREIPRVEYKVQATGLSASERAAAEEYLAHSRLMEVSGRYAEALEKNDAALRLAPSDADLKVRRDRLAVIARFFPKLSNYKTDPAEAAIRRSAQAFLAGQDRLAVDKAVEAAAIKPEDVDISEFLGRLEKETGIRPSAAAPAGPAPVRSASALTRADAALDERDYDAAAAAAQDAVREDPENVDAWKALGTARFARLEYEASLKAWQTAYELESSPSERSRIRERIKAVERQLKRRVRARPAPRPAPPVVAPPPVAAPVVPAAPPAAPKLSAEQVKVLMDQGVESYMRGDYPSAKQAFSQILDSDPTNEDAFNALRRVKEKEAAP